ncbi:hypothetical protein Hanom_Chr09g00825991 [Helianthus anomalus]
MLFFLVSWTHFVSVTDSIKTLLECFILFEKVTLLYLIYTMFQSLLSEGKEMKQKESKNILCSRVSFKEGKERKIKHVVFPSFI